MEIKADLSSAHQSGEDYSVESEKLSSPGVKTCQPNPITCHVYSRGHKADIPSSPYVFICPPNMSCLALKYVFVNIRVSALLKLTLTKRGYCMALYFQGGGGVGRAWLRASMSEVGIQTKYHIDRQLEVRQEEEVMR